MSKALCYCPKEWKEQWWVTIDFWKGDFWIVFTLLTLMWIAEETSMKHMPSIGLPGHWQQLELGSTRVESFPCSSLQNPHEAETSRSNISDAMAYSSIHRDWQLHHFVGISHICNHLCIYVTYCIIYIYVHKSRRMTWKIYKYIWYTYCNLNLIIQSFDVGPPCRCWELWPSSRDPIKKPIGIDPGDAFRGATPAMVFLKIAEQIYMIFCW